MRKIYTLLRMRLGNSFLRGIESKADPGWEHYTRRMGHSTASLDLSVAGIAEKVGQGLRIGREEARWFWENASDAELCSMAGSVRNRFHASGSCTYMVMRIINYTNVRVAQCDYCAFIGCPAGGRLRAEPRRGVRQTRRAVGAGRDLAAFNGGFNPHLPLSYYCELFAAIRARHRDSLEFYALTIAEFMYPCRSRG